MSEPAVPVARRLLPGGPDGLEVLMMHQFPDDGDAHDEGTQRRARRAVDIAFDDAEAELTAEFGPPAGIGTQNAGAIPLCGIIRWATWAAGGQTLYLAAAHEDRELPLLLALGTI